MYTEAALHGMTGLLNLIDKVVTHRDEFSYSDREATITENTVCLNVYHLNDKLHNFNKIAKNFETGVYHAGIEVYGSEYAYGECDRGTGISKDTPRQHCYHTYYRTHVLGRTLLTEQQVKRVVKEMESDWPGKEYHLIEKNCISFCMDMTQRLGIDPNCYPRYLASMMRFANRTMKHSKRVKNRLEEHNVFDNKDHRVNQDSRRIKCDEGGEYRGIDDRYKEKKRHNVKTRHINSHEEELYIDSKLVGRDTMRHVDSKRVDHDHMGSHKKKYTHGVRQPIYMYDDTSNNTDGYKDLILSSKRDRMHRSEVYYYAHSESDKYDRSQGNRTTTSSGALRQSPLGTSAKHTRRKN